MISIPLWLFIVLCVYFGVAFLFQGVLLALTLPSQIQNFKTPEAWVNLFRETWATGSCWPYLLLNLVFAAIRGERLL